MKKFDIDKLERAIVYTERMAEGRVPYSNQPVEDEILNNPNVIRCMYYINEVLQEVRKNGGYVGDKKKNNPKDILAFPFEVLSSFKYKEDMPISHVLKQFSELTGNPDRPIISAQNINKWLAAKGYIEKVVVNEEGKECWIPTKKGEGIGLVPLKRGESGKEYIRIDYKEEAQQFLADNLKTITEEWYQEIAK